MSLTRAEFLKWMSAAAGLGAAGLAGGTAAAAGGGPGAGDRTQAEDGGPPRRGDEMSASLPLTADSRRFRRAVEKGDLPAVESMLRDDPALAWSRDARGRSMLVLAWLAGHREVAERLRRDLTGLDLVEAALCGDGERVGELLRKFPGLVNEPHPSGGTAVHAAARLGRAGLLGSMVVAGADFNVAGAEPPGLTPLRLAVEYPDLAVAEEMADMMLGNAADPRVPQGDGLTPLHAAAAAGSGEMIRLLVLDGADVTARAPDGATPLDLAVRHRRAQAADLLRGERRLPRSHRTSRFAYTAGGAAFTPQPQPLLAQPVINEYVAVSHGNLARVRELLALYPSLLLANAPWNELAVEAGAHTGFKDGVRLQLDRGAPLSICTAAMMGLGAHVRRLLDEDPLRVWEAGAHNMPLMWFPAIGAGGLPAGGDHLEIVSLLLDRGADVNAHKRGYTALHWAARGGAVELADLLLARGADINARRKTSGKDETPLAQALQAKQSAVAELLRRKGGVV